MSVDLGLFAVIVSWAASGIGLAMWVWSWFLEKNPIQRMRFLDCGLVLIASAVLLRIVVQEKPMSVFDWTWTILSPLFIAGALWRLARTACPPGDAG